MVGPAGQVRLQVHCAYSAPGSGPLIVFLHFGKDLLTSFFCILATTCSPNFLPFLHFGNDLLISLFADSLERSNSRTFFVECTPHRTCCLRSRFALQISGNTETYCAPTVVTQYPHIQKGPRAIRPDRECYSFPQENAGSREELLTKQPCDWTR